MLLSRIYAHAKREDLAAKIFGKPADVDVDHYLSKQFAAAEAEQKKTLLAYSKSDVHVDRFMPNFSIAYRGQETLIADLALPIVPVDNASNKFVVWDRRMAMAITDDEVGPLGRVGQVYQDFSSSTYTCIGRALMSQVANDILVNSDAPLDLLSEAASDVRDRLARNREDRAASLIMTAANYAAANSVALSGTNRWDVVSGSTADPISDIMNAMANVGVAAPINAIVMSLPVWTAFRKHPKVVAALGGFVQSTAAGVPLGAVATVEAVRQFFGLDYFLVGNAKKDTANPGNATAAFNFIWGKGCALLRLNPGAGMNQLAFAKTFRHQLLNFTSWFDPSPGVSGATLIKGGFSDSEKVTAADAGYLIDTVIS